VSAIGQIAPHVTDADRAEAFCRDTPGLTRQYRFGQRSSSTAAASG